MENKQPFCISSSIKPIPIMEEENQEDNYNVIRSIGYLFYNFEGFYYFDSKRKENEQLFDFWPKCKDDIKKRIDIINNCLDAYDFIFPIDYPKPILTVDDIEGIHKILRTMLIDTRYNIMNEVGVDLNLELGCPGWIDLKKLILRFLSKIKIKIKIKNSEEILEGDRLIKYYGKLF